MLSRAIIVATAAHRGVMDKNGEPYILHPLRVMIAVKSHGEVAMAAAVLHDVIEDTPHTRLSLAAEGIPDVVIEAVESVSRPDGETYFDFVRRAGWHPVGRLIKIADIKDNLRDPFPFGSGMRVRYFKALALLGDGV